MLPVLIRLEFLGVKIRLGGYAVAVFCGAAAALWIALRRAKESGLSSRAAAGIFLPTVAAGFVGARLASWIQFGGHPLRGGLVLYGGLLAGLATLILACRWRRLPVLRVVDLALPCALLAASFGRLGCALAGCCYGTPSLWGLAYPRGSHAFRDHVSRGWIDPDAVVSLPTTPMPLLEAAVLLLLAAILSVVWRASRRPGTVLGLAGLCYPAWRFAAEYWRGDHGPFWGPHLTFSQGISLVLFASSIALLLRRRPDVAWSPVPHFAATRLQTAAFFVVVTAATAGVACTSIRPRPQEMSGETVLRGGCSTKEDRDEAYRSAKEEVADCMWDCMWDCISDCISDCIDSCIQATCHCDGENAQPASPVPARVAAVVRERIRKTGSYDGRVGLRVTLNGRLDVTATLQGKLTVVESPAKGPLKLSGRVEYFKVIVGEQTIGGTGDLEIELTERLQAVIVRATLPEEVLCALKAVEPLFGGHVSLETEVVPDPSLLDLIRKELKEPEIRLQGAFSSFVNSEGTLMHGSGSVIRLDSGDLRVKWTVTED